MKITPIFLDEQDDKSTYWMYTLIWIIIVISIIALDSLTEEYLDFTWNSIILGIFFLATLIPWLAVNVRRLHDTEKSGGYLFVNLIPLIGRIWYIVLMSSTGDHFSNKYSPDPKVPNIDEIDDIGKPFLEE